MAQNSETVVVKRSMIKMHPQNIKNHSQEEIKLQKKNIKKIGYLGGVVFNEFTGHLIDGHRRVQALDEINKYDGTPETDYEIKVEQVVMDEKTERQQMAYMALANGKADYNLVANIIDDIEYKDIGLSDEEYTQILNLRELDEELDNFADMTTMEEEFAPKPKEKAKTNGSEENTTQEERVGFTPSQAPEERQGQAPQQEGGENEGMPSTPLSARAPVTELPSMEITNQEFRQRLDEKPKMTKEEVKKEKQHCTNVNNGYMDNVERYIIVNFANQDEKVAFCEALGLTAEDNMVVDGHVLLEAFDM